MPAADRPSPLVAGPLRVHPDNPRYFTDGTAPAVAALAHSVHVDATGLEIVQAELERFIE